MKWSIFGATPKNPSPAWTGLVLAFLFAAQTFIDNSSGYPLLMAWLAIFSAIAFSLFGFRAKSFLSFLFVPVGALFALPLLGVVSFDNPNPIMFLSHALLAILFGIASYSYLATERRTK